MRIYLSAALAAAVLVTPASAVAQNNPTPPVVDHADLVALLADFNAENGAGPLDGCALQEGGEMDVAAVVRRRPELAARIDVVESPCSIERHHETRFNRGFVEAVRPQADHTEVVFLTVVGDGYTRWTLRIVQGPGGGEIEEAVNSGVVYAHAGGLAAAGTFDLASTAGALGLSSTVRFRIDGTLFVRWPQNDSVALVDVRGVWPEPGMGVEAAVGQHGFFLARLACLDRSVLAAVSAIARVAAASDAICEPRDDHRTDILLGAAIPVPPNLWRHQAFGITNDLVWVVEVTRDMEGNVLNSYLIGAIRLQSGG